MLENSPHSLRWLAAFETRSKTNGDQFTDTSLADLAKMRLKTVRNINKFYRVVNGHFQN